MDRTASGEDVVLALHTYEAAAKERLPGPVWDFFAGGSGTESMLTAGRDALDRIRLRPRCLVDVSRCDPGTELLGARLAAPLGIAPMAYHRLAHPEGEVATARAAGDAGALLTVSMFASRTLEDIAAAATGPLWLQLYWLRRRDLMADLIRRAEAAGFRALVLTVDAPRVAFRPRDAANGFAVPSGIRAVNLAAEVMAASHGSRAGESAIARHSAEQFDSSVTWDDLAWLHEVSSLPLVLKGVLTGDDARLAVEHGVSGLVVSNHGGRQLDFARSAPDCLTEVVDAVAGGCRVVLDGGIRYGADIAKALCLGADAVMIGRPALWGLAHSGTEGVTGVLRLLMGEFEEVMALMGAPTVADFGRSGIATP
ncbi:alpha-hydroxy acid oxidase [Streptomyces fuscichromogenes]|uniref:Alpha-hydroxy-acid oxidizing enzyme n=1 Tax=Streptomyces fuscichromogenes TaxID=1324013 RepID=A0A917X7K4_9ACTN|nr:alpha-hydroxy acid oxidase [Streptomyces fuscichromogenes]GGM85758.1 alpha-hydroxy-acid oxidizing enzyme [Streptomyces fuscichromogenes]